VSIFKLQSILIIVSADSIQLIIVPHMLVIGWWRRRKLFRKLCNSILCLMLICSTTV